MLVAGVGIGDLVVGKLLGMRLNKFMGESLCLFLVCVGRRTLTLATYVREWHLRKVRYVATEIKPMVTIMISARCEELAEDQ